MKLILFDIDGTLLHSGGAGARALARAFLDLHQIENVMVDIVFAGMTDPSIVADIFAKKLGRAEKEGELEQILERYLFHLPEEMHRSEGAKVLPGVEPLLEALHRRQDVVMGLLTGNIEPGARVKLGRFGLNRYFQFGGFATDSRDRNEIARVARERGEQAAGRAFEPADVIVVGDTPRDITCGRAIQARVLAVATGPHKPEELAPHAPDWLLENLGQTDQVVELLMTGTMPAR